MNARVVARERPGLELGSAACRGEASDTVCASPRRAALSGADVQSVRRSPVPARVRRGARAAQPCLEAAVPPSRPCRGAR